MKEFKKKAVKESIKRIEKIYESEGVTVNQLIKEGLKTLDKELGSEGLTAYVMSLLCTIDEISCISGFEEGYKKGISEKFNLLN